MMLFEQLSNLLGTGEQLQFTMTRTGNGQLKLLLTPILDQPPEDLPEAAAQARAALALPLTLTATPEELDGGVGGGFLAILADYAATRANVKDSLNTLSTLKTAAASAGAAAVKARQQAGAADTSAQGRAQPPAPPAATAQAAIPPPERSGATTANTNPDSLF